MTDYTSTLSFAAPALGRNLLATVKCAASVWRSRQVLATLEAHQLEDIGLTQFEAEIEAKRSFWDH